MKLPAVSLKEAKRLVRRWGRATFDNRVECIEYHIDAHGAANPWRYLRKAYAFRKRGARRVRLSNGAIRYERGREFLIERDGKVVSYGIKRAR